MNKTVRLIFALGLLVIVIAAISRKPDPVDTRSSIKLGVILPLGGANAAAGEGAQNAIRIASPMNVMPVYQDDACDGKKALSAYDLLRQQGAKVFYVACSGSVMALAPLIEQNGDLLLTAYAGSAAIRSTGPNVIRFIPDALSVTAVMETYLKSQPGKEWALLYENQDYAKSAAEALKRGLGDSIIIEESYNNTDISYLTTIAKIKASRADGLIWMPTSDSAATRMIQQMQMLGFSLPVIGEVNLCDYPFNPADFGIHGVCWRAELAGPGFEAFEAKYKEGFGASSPYPFYDAITYDVVKILDRLAAKHGDDVLAIRNEILFGVSGSVSKYDFDRRGEVRNVGSYLKIVEF